MITAAGNINQPYTVIGVVHATASRLPGKGGCGQATGIPVEAAYGDATKALIAAAEASGATGLIHIGYNYRMSSQQVGCNNVQPSFEVYAWGTAVRLAA